eukprot:g22374.t1
MGRFEVAVGVSGLEIDISFKVDTRDGNREVQEGERGIRDGPGELDVGVEGVSKVDELFKLLVRAQGGADTVIDVAEEEVGDSASVAAEAASTLNRCSSAHPLMWYTVSTVADVASSTLGKPSGGSETVLWSTYA